MTKEKIQNLVNEEWSRFLASFEGLGENELQELGVVGYWSIRDIIVHITTWEEQALEALPLIVSKMPVRRYTKYGGIDGFNAQEQVRKSDYSLTRAKKELFQVHRMLIGYLQSIPEGVFKDNKRLTKRIYWDAYGHYREHTKQILAWRQKKGL